MRDGVLFCIGQVPRLGPVGCRCVGCLRGGRGNSTRSNRSAAQLIGDQLRGPRMNAPIRASNRAGVAAWVASLSSRGSCPGGFARYRVEDSRRRALLAPASGGRAAGATTFQPSHRVGALGVGAAVGLHYKSCSCLSSSSVVLLEAPAAAKGHPPSQPEMPLERGGTAAGARSDFQVEAHGGPGRGWIASGPDHTGVGPRERVVAVTARGTTAASRSSTGAGARIQGSTLARHPDADGARVAPPRVTAVARRVGERRRRG